MRAHRVASVLVRSPRLLVVTVLALLGFTQTLAAQDNSLALVPKDAFFYQAHLRYGEQVQAIAKSRAWARLTALPAFKLGWQKVEEQWNDGFGPVAMVKQWYEQDDNRKLVQLLGQMFAEEVFVYGRRDAVEFAMFMNDINMANQLAPLQMLAKGGAQAFQQPEDRFRFVVQSIAQHPERIKVPDVVIGFKLSDPKEAARQLERLENLVQFVPPLQERFKKITIGTGKFLSLNLDGKMVPWELLPIRNFEEKAGDFDGLMKRLNALKLSINLGVQGRYLLLGLGESADSLATLGKGPSLRDQAEMKALAKFADKRLTHINYMSKECKTLLAPSQKDLDDTLSWGMDLLKEVGLTPAQEAKLRKDLKALTNEFFKNQPIPGASLSFSFLSDAGQEGYSYDWTGNASLDATKSLSLLNHLGGSPLFFVCTRNKHAPEEYDSLVKFLKLAHQYFEELGLPRIPPEAQQQYEQVMKIARPLLVRLDKATGKMLVPALADGQDALLLDAKLASPQWHKNMPPAAKPLPLPELALVIGVSDAALLRKAMEEYRTIGNDLIAEINKMVPGGPNVNIPAPESRKVAGGTLYFYPIPDMAGLDKKFSPSAGLSEKIAVLSLSQEHSSRLLSPTPLGVLGRPLAKSKGPLAGAAYFDFAGFIGAAQPWLDFAFQQAQAPDDIQSQVRTVLQVLQVLRSYSSVTYLEGGAVVSHSETIIRDLER